MSKRVKRAASILMTLVMVFSVIGFYSAESYAAKIDNKTKVQLKSANKPTTITKGSKYTVKGKLSSNKTMKRVEIGIVKASTNKWTKYKYDNKKVNSKTFKINKVASKLKFQKLSPGEYYYRIYAHTSRGVVTVLNTKFKVAEPPAPETVTAATSSDSLLVTILNKITGKAGDNVVLSSYNFPDNYNVGKGYSVKGKITCSNTIKRVEIGIVVTGSNKWTEYKYDNTAVNAKAFDISKAAPSLMFDKLPGGEFTYRIYVHTENGVATLLNRTFEVKPSSNPQKAIAWAEKIAADNNYTYGKGYGEYSQCCICAGKTKKASHAQFTCMPFLAAAYAHGTGNLDLLNKGKTGYHYMHLNDKNFKSNLGGVWFKVGLCKDLTIDDLQPGDVIIKWSDNDSTGHAWMYGGDDKIIEAVPADIRVLSNGAAAKLRRYGTTEGTPSKNYVMRFRG